VAVLSASISLLSVLCLACAVCSCKSALYGFGSLLLFAIPGWPLGLALFGRGSHRRPEWLIFGSILGVALSSSAALVVGYSFGWSPRSVVAALVVLTLGCVLVGAACWDRPVFPSLREWEKWEYLLLGGMIVVLTVFAAWPFLNIGRLTRHGYAYTWLFGYDFLVRGEYILAMTRGLPPTALPLAGQSLRMYLVGYSLPAFIYSASAKAVALHRALLLSSLGFNSLLCGGILVFLRTFYNSKRVLLSTVSVFLFGSSFYWLVPAAKFILSMTGTAHGASLYEPLKLAKYGNVSHLLTPLVLVEPQAVLATCLVLFLIVALELSRYDLDGFLLSTVLGVTLGVLFGTDALWGLTAMLWFGCVAVYKLVTERLQVTRRFLSVCTATGVCALISGVFFWFGMYEPSHARQVYFEPYSWLVKFGLFYFPIEFGPLLLLGVWGFLRTLRRSEIARFWPLLALGLIALVEVGFFGFSVLPKTRMAVRVLPFVLVVGVGQLFKELYETHKQQRRIRIVWAIVLIAIPTVFTDLYFTSDVSDINETRYVSPVDRNACDWIRSSLPETAVVQGEPEYLGFSGGHNVRQDLFISLIADFAERPQALGWNYVAGELPPDGDTVVAARMVDIERMLSASDPGTILAVARKYSISYIYDGPYEQLLHPTLLGLLTAAPYAFEQVYGVDCVHIFRIKTLASEIARQKLGN
jgi:hypothetical protein